MIFGKKKEINLLELKPVRLYEFSNEENGNVVVMIPRFKREFFNNWLSVPKKGKFIKLKLDEIGSNTWKLMDGNRNVQQICDLMTEEFGENIKPAEERVSAFVRQLLNDRIIKLT